MPSALLEVKALSKSFAKFKVLENVSLNVNEGEIFGLLGPNGAGKTTLIKCIFKFLKFSSGEVFYKDKPLNLSQIHSDFGYLPENFFPPTELTGREFLKTLSLSLNKPSHYVDFLLKKVGLQDKKKIKHYSKGMVQRLGLACALLKEPKVLILDEPTLGLDPLGQREILILLKELKEEKKTIFFSSHNLFQVGEICDRIGIIHQGRMKFIGRIEEFLAKNNSNTLEEAFLKEIGDAKDIFFNPS